MKIFYPFPGHPELDYSMHLLFEHRLGHELYRPIGEEWEAYRVKGPTISSELFDSTKTTPDGLQVVHSSLYDYTLRFMSWDYFMAHQFDLFLVASWEQEPGAVILRDAFCPHAKMIRHIANIHEPPQNIKNILLSTKEPIPKGYNHIQYYPEHHSRFCYTAPSDSIAIRSFSNYLRSYPREWALWEATKQALPEFKFYNHGVPSEDANGIIFDGWDGIIFRHNMFTTIQDTKFIWHLKAGVCGYLPRQALSCGKPLIVDKRSARHHNTLALDYLKDQVNCIDINPEVRTMEEAANLVREWAKPDQYKERCEIVYKTFLQDVNFDAEAEAIRLWIEKLL